MGSTAVKAIVVDRLTGEPVSESVGASASCRADGVRREVDPADLLGAVDRVVSTVLAKAQALPGEVVTSTQMHSAILTDASDAPVSPIISWQDDRLLERGHDGRSALQALIASAGPGAWERSGIAHRPGFGAGNLGAWLRENPVDAGRRPRVHTIGSFVAASFGGPYATHLSNAAALGVVDVRAGAWSRDLIELHGLGGCSLPTILTTHDVAGSVRLGGVEMRWRGDVGDHQASVLGSGGLAPDEVALSLGTAGIVARISDTMSQDARVDSRPYLDGRFLQAVSRLPGGAMAGELAGLLARVVAELAGVRVDRGDLWRRAAELPATGAAVPHLTYDRALTGRRDLRLAGLDPGSSPLRQTYEALIGHYVDAYRASIDLLCPNAPRPRRVRFNGGLAVRNEAFRSALAAGLGLEVADVAAGDLALRGLRHLLGIDQSTTGRRT